MYESLLSNLRSANDAARLQILADYFSNSEIPEREKSPQLRDPENDTPQSEESTIDELNELLSETSVDEEGRICFYGATSLFHLQPDQAKIFSTELLETAEPNLLNVNETLQWERPVQWQNNRTLRTSRPLLSATTQSDFGTFLSPDVSSSLCNELLEIYWAWPHHLHRVLSRKLFTRKHELSLYVTHVMELT